MSTSIRTSTSGRLATARRAHTRGTSLRGRPSGAGPVRRRASECGRARASAATAHRATTHRNHDRAERTAH
eukprot:2128651-Prymnesium_polylepis.1